MANPRFIRPERICAFTGETHVWSSAEPTEGVRFTLNNCFSRHTRITAIINSVDLVDLDGLFAEKIIGPFR